MGDPAPRPLIRLIGWAVIVLVPVLVVAAGAELVLRAIGLGDPVLYEAHPAYGYAPQPKQRRERRRDAVVTIDSRGLRTPVDWREPARHHILFIGDSVTYGGSYVDDTELFSERVCAELAARHGLDANCGNAGVNAYGTDNMAARLAAENFGAELIVVVVLPGDVLRGLRQIEGLPFHTRPLPPVIPALSEAAIFAWRYASSRLGRLTAANAAPPPAPPSPAEAEARQARVVAERIERLLDVLRHKQAFGIKALLVLTPGRDALTGTDPLTEQVHQALAASGLPYVDMRPHLREGDLDALYYDDVHLDPPGHALYGEVLSRRIAELLGAGDR